MGVMKEWAGEKEIREKMKQGSRGRWKVGRDPGRQKDRESNKIRRSAGPAPFESQFLSTRQC